jgi:hypothetical protein
MAPSGGPQSFFWSELEEILETHAPHGSWEVDASRGLLIAPDVCVRPPAVLPIQTDAARIDGYLASIPDELGLHLVVLAQAGAAALGIFEDGEALATKTIRKYVVRGSGRAQPGHLRTKGKSRYGSRLRLRNANNLRDEVHERLREWVDLYGRPQLLFNSCPVRLWSELFETATRPAIEKRDPWIRIQKDLPSPNTEILLRTYRGLCYGRLE